jgi:hypothetical protein
MPAETILHHHHLVLADHRVLRIERPHVADRQCTRRLSSEAHSQFVEPLGGLFGFRVGELRHGILKAFAHRRESTHAGEQGVMAIEPHRIRREVHSADAVHRQVLAFVCQ